MAEIQIAWLELMTVGGLGVILVLLGVTFNIIVKRQNKLCTKKTDGIVKQYVKCYNKVVTEVANKI